MTPAFPQIIIFDVDGVLVNVRESFHRTVLETVRHFTRRRVSRYQLYAWKNRPGYNDDWKLSHAWVRTLGGGRHSFEEVKRKFQEIYWGAHYNGNVARERWLLPAATLRRLARRAELSIFTGRTRQELDHTLDKFRTRSFFRTIITVEDVAKGKPNPEGLLRILDGRPVSTALYVGDNVDDATAAHNAGVPFLGILANRSEAHRHGRARLLKLGARAVLPDIRAIESWLDHKAVRRSS
ncbi:MAG: HAD-IA family hydrolase [Candidatus Acidiferrales bacterium]